MVEKYKLYTGFLFGALWALLCFNFIAEELVPPLEKLRPAVYLMCDGIFIVLGLIAMRNRRDILIFATFLLIALVSKYLNHLGFIYFINGFRDFIGLIFAFPIIRYLWNSKNGERFIKSFDRQLYLFLWLQAFCLTWQFIRYGANDHGGGTLGFGGSGTISTLIYFVSFYLITKRWDDVKSYWQNLRANKVLVFLFFPTFLNETKISFIFFACYFLLLLRIDWSLLRKLMLASPRIFVGVLGVGYVYLSVTDQEADYVLSYDFFQNYLVGEDIDFLVEMSEKVQDGLIETDNVWTVDIPRFSKILLAPEAVEKTGGGQLFGAGLGQLKGGTVLAYTPFAFNNKWLINGSRPWWFSLFIQLGYIGIIWFFINMAGIIGMSSGVPRGLNIKIFLWVIVLLSLFYNDSLRIFPYCFLLFYGGAYSTFGVPAGVDNKDLKNVDRQR